MFLPNGLSAKAPGLSLLGSRWPQTGTETSHCAPRKSKGLRPSESCCHSKAGAAKLDWSQESACVTSKPFNLSMHLSLHP